NGSPGNGGHAVPAVSCFPGGETDAAICTVSRKGPSCGGVRTACHLQSEGCEYPDRKPWHPRADRYHRGRYTPCLEETDAAVHCGRDSVLYASGADGVLRKRMRAGRQRILCQRK